MHKPTLKKVVPPASASPVQPTTGQGGGTSVDPVLEALNQMKLEQAESFNALRSEMKLGFAKIDKRFQNLEERVLQNTDSQAVMSQQIDDLEATNQILYRDEMILELENSAKILRIQNLLYQKDENLYILVGQSLAEVLGISFDDFMRETDTIFRQSTAYTRKNKLPAEVIVKLTKRRIRDDILKATQGKEITINNDLVKILKDVPWKIRQARKGYAFFTALLIKKNIRYKWLYPEGVSFQFGNKNVRLDSWSKAKDFAESHAAELGYVTTDQTSSEEENGTQAESTQQFQEPEGAVGGAKPKRLLRQKHKKSKE